MLGTARHALARLTLPLAERLSSDSWVNLPRPRETRLVVRAAGAVPDRVLLAGNSLAVGWGVASHNLALAGTLARATASITGRGVDLEVHVRPDKTLRMVERFLTPQTIARYDAIVLALGAREAFQMIPRETWRRCLTRVLDQVARLASSPPPVLVVAADEITQVPIAAAPARRAIEAVRALNATTRELVASRQGVVFVESAIVSSSGTGQEFFYTDKLWMYEHAASTIAPALARVLGQGGAADDPLDERARERAISRVRARLTEDDPELAQLVSMTRDLFGAAEAALLLVESDDIRPIIAHESLVKVDRPESFSAAAILQRHGLVVPDLLADERFRERPDVVNPPHWRAYAGHHVESPDGQPVAVLGMVFAHERHFSPADLALLRALAHRAGEVLFRPPNG